jgi:hypothetical protein
MVMNKNTYLGLVLTACLSITSAPLLAEVDPATDINAPIPKFNEPLQPSEAQRQQAEQNKANIPAPPTSVKEYRNPSKHQSHKARRSKARTTAPETSATDFNAPIPKFNEPLEPSEAQRQQEEQNTQ